MTVSIIDRAADFARRKHVDQYYGGDDFFEAHVERVVEVVREFTDDAATIAAAYLHDTVEDTDTTFEEIATEFGDEVADIVWLVTDPEGEGWSREEKKQALYDQFKTGTPTLRLKAAVVKCGDRIANHRKSLSTINLSKMRMYLREFTDFLATFGTPIVGTPAFKGLWDTLLAQHNALYWKIETYR